MIEQNINQSFLIFNYLGSLAPLNSLSAEEDNNRYGEAFVAVAAITSLASDRKFGVPDGGTRTPSVRPDAERASCR